MPRFAANLHFLYTELPFWRRFAAAAADGFQAVELLFPYEHDAGELAAQLSAHGLTLLFFNATPRAHAGERGIACLPDQRAAFRERFLRALAYADAVGTPHLHVMSGIAPEQAPRALLHDTYIDNLRWAAAQARRHGRTILIEPINPTDMPGFFLNHQAQAHAIVEEVGVDNLQVMMDLYHCAKVEGDVLACLRTHLPTGRVGHIQIAGLPERQEPASVGGAGQLNWEEVFRWIDQLGYGGWVGAEYHPARGQAPGATSQGLQWLQAADGCRAPRPARLP
jgi:hydroxypyruvate isomerase